jgi:threonylcarbamoyladenosine tRNA methylthiotransferase CDKAL1
MKILIEAYGCSMNRGEAAEFKDAAVSAGHSIVRSESEADAAVIFTCGVIETTERRMLRRIRELSRLDPLLICGCLGVISPDKIATVAPYAIIFRPTEHQNALDRIQDAGGGAGTASPEHLGIGILPIASGCIGECSYCVTRLARGDLRSRPLNELVDRASALVVNGAVELQVCAQDTAIYGKDSGTDLGTLISAIAELDGKYMMRIGMMNPKNALADVDAILALYENERVFKFLHLPVQSGSDAVLNRMRRGYAVKDFFAVLEAFRSRFPESTVSTDIITGFPAETDDEHAETVDLIRKVEPDIVNVTRFSPRPRTPASSMREQVPSGISKDRSRMLTDLRFDVLSKKFEKRVGMTVNALSTEHRQPGTTFLRSRDYWPVVIKEHLPLGGWYNIRITGAEKTHLVGALYPNH